MRRFNVSRRPLQYQVLRTGLFGRLNPEYSKRSSLHRDGIVENRMPQLKIVERASHSVPSSIVVPRNSAAPSTKQLQRNQRIVDDVLICVRRVHENEIERVVEF